MKKGILIILLLASIISIYAQEINLWQNFRASALTPANKIHLRWETISNPLDTLELIYKNNGQLLTIYPANDLLAYNAVINNPDSDAPSIALRSMMDNYGVLTPLKLATTTAVSPALMVKACDDSLNEAVTQGDTKLDIKSFHFSYNDTQLMAGIVNQNGTYPNGVTILGPFYVYGAGLINPENIMDSTAYALINTNVVGLMTPGLYKLHGGDFTNFQDFDFSAIQRVGNISTSTTNGMLIMKCDWNTLINDEDFGTWPSFSKSLAFVPFIMKLDISDLQNVNGDIGSPALINFTDLSLNPVNTIPSLSNHTVSHLENTSVVSISYHDENNNFPLYSTFKIGELYYPMLPQTLDFSNEVVFSTVIPSLDWSAGTCYFSDDSTNVVTYQIENVVKNDELPLIQKIKIALYPNPLNSVNQELKMEIKADSPLQKVSIYNLKGQLVKDINIDNQGNSTNLSWDTKDFKGNNVTSGIYFLKVSTQSTNQYRKFMIIK